MGSCVYCGKSAGFFRKLYITRTIIFALSIVVLISCNTGKDLDKIKIGMTYEEVESILEPPAAIERGTSGFSNDVSDLSNEDIRSLVLDTVVYKLESKRLILPPKLQTIGQLVYVSWVYKKERTDTLYLLRYKIKFDTIRTKAIRYFVNNRQVNKYEYNHTSNYEYRDHKNSKIPKSLYDAYIESNSFKMPPPIKINKRIDNGDDISIEKSFSEDVYKEKYLVRSIFKVLFDASSGRVVKADYFPINVKPIPERDAKNN